MATSFGDRSAPARVRQPGCRNGLGRVEQCLKTRDKLVARRTELEAKEAELRRIEPVCAALAVEAGLSEIEGLDCIRLADRFERRLDEMTRAWERSRDLETRFVEARRRLEEAKTEEAAAAALLADWRRRWAVAVGALGLEGDASIEAAETALEVWDRAFNDAENHRNRVRRVAGIERNMSDFETEARALVQRCAPALADLPAEAAARLLNERLVAGAHGRNETARGGRAEGDGARRARRGARSPWHGQGDDGDEGGLSAPGLRRDRLAARARASAPASPRRSASIGFASPIWPTGSTRRA